MVAFTRMRTHHVPGSVLDEPVRRGADDGVEVVTPPVGGRPTVAGRERLFPRDAPWVWIALVTALVAVIVLLHVHGRAPLTWDEAARVDSGSRLLFAVRSGSLDEVWRWFNAQTYYPFLMPAVHGLVLAATGSPLAAASVPTILAYVGTGLLAARLARALGAGGAGAWTAALLAWLCPIGLRLAAGAFTENLGACVVLGLTLSLLRLERSARDPGPATADAVRVGAVVLLAWLVKYDYGILATALLGLAGVRALLRLQPRRALQLYGTAAAVGLAPVALLLASFAEYAPGRLDAVRTFVLQPGIERQIDFLFYPRALLLSDEVGLAPVVAILLLSGFGWCLAAANAERSELRTPILSVVVWLVVYSVAAAKQPRFAVLVIPLLGVLAAVAVAAIRDQPEKLPTAAQLALWTMGGAVLLAPRGSLVFSLIPLAVPVAALALVDLHVLRGLAISAKGIGRWAVAGALAAPLLWQVGAQASALGEPIWLVRPDPATAEALAFTVNQIPASTDRPVLFIGPSNAFSPRLLDLAWSELLDRPSPGVETVPEVRPEEREGALLAAIRTHNPSVIVAVSAGGGARLNPDRNAAGRELFPSQRAYAGMIGDLARQGGPLSPLPGLGVEHEPVRVEMWNVEQAALRGVLLVSTSPALRATISVDGVPRSAFGLGIDLPVGIHEVCFGPMGGYSPPACERVTITVGGTTSVVGTYKPAPGAPPAPVSGGLLSVRTPPAVPSQISIDGVARANQALDLRVDAGPHRVCFRYVPGFRTPDCELVTVEEGGSASVVATFEKDDFQPVRG